MTENEDANDIKVRLPSGPAMTRTAERIDNAARWLARHWLAVFNVLITLFVAMPMLAPVLMNAGATGAGRLIYTLYSPTCHQLPERSFFLFGRQHVYTVEELEHARAVPDGLTLFQREFLRWPGNDELGYKIAFCERDLAMYGSLVVAGLLFGAVRGPWERRRRVPKLPLWAYALFLLPMALDGGTQLFMVRESTWELRLLTGVLFGFATVWLAYPHVQEAMEGVLAPPRRI